MDVHNTSIHIMISQDTVSHICHVLNLTETMEGDLTVNAVVALLGTVLMPWSLNKSRCYGIDPDSLWLKFLYQRLGKEMNGCLGHSIYYR